MGVVQSMSLQREYTARITLSSDGIGRYWRAEAGSQPEAPVELTAGVETLVGPFNETRSLKIEMDRGTFTRVISYDGLNKTKVDALTSEDVEYTNTELGCSTVDGALDELAERSNATKGPDITTTGTGTYTINAANGIYQKITVAHNITLAFTFPASQVSGLCLEIVNGGAHTITWPGTMRFAGKEEPVLTASGSDLLAIFTDGTTLNCSVTASDIGVPA